MASEPPIQVYVCRILRRELIPRILGAGYLSAEEAGRYLSDGEVDLALPVVERALKTDDVSKATVMKLRELVETHMLGFQPLVTTSQLDRTEWQYRFDAPPQDSAATEGSHDWRVGRAPFGNLPESVTPWPQESSHLWLKKEFDWSGDRPKKLILRAAIDDTFEAKLNGIRLASHSYWTSRNYINVDCTEAGIKSLRQGRNVLEIRCENFEWSDRSQADFGLYYSSDGHSPWTEMLDRAIKASPNSLTLLRERAYQSVMEDQFDHAARQWEALYAQTGNLGELFEAVRLFALAGNQSEYRRICRQKVKPLVQDYPKARRIRLIQQCLLMPGAHDVCEGLHSYLIEKADRRGARLHEIAICAVLDFRCGRRDEALRRIDQIRSLEKDAGIFDSKFALAIAYPLLVLLENRENPESNQLAAQALSDIGFIFREDGSIVGRSLANPASQDELKWIPLLGIVLSREAEQIGTLNQRTSPVGQESTPNELDSIGLFISIACDLPLSEKRVEGSHCNVSNGIQSLQEES